MKVEVEVASKSVIATESARPDAVNSSIIFSAIFGIMTIEIIN